MSDFIPHEIHGFQLVSFVQCQQLTLWIPKKGHQFCGNYKFFHYFDINFKYLHLILKFALLGSVGYGWGDGKVYIIIWRLRHVFK